MTPPKTVEPAPLRAMLAVPTRGDIWYETATAILPYEPIFYREKLSVASVRNRIARDFLQNKYGHKDVLFMCDDDTIPASREWAAHMAAAPYDIVGAPVPMAKMPDLPIILNAFNWTDDGRWVSVPPPIEDDAPAHSPVDAVGFGLVMIRRQVLEHPEMRQPFTQTLDEDGVIMTGQDFNFCIRAKKLGFTVGVAWDAECDHFVRLHLNTVPYVYGAPTGHLPNQVEEPV